jgi:hypothetical protein
MPNPIYMADGIPPPLLNPEFVSRYDGLVRSGVVMLQSHDERHQTHGVFFELLA